MKKYRSAFILLNLILLLLYFNYSLMKKETLLVEGELVLLELAPVDPRSLMQGDYMRLRYAIANDVNRKENPTRGYCIVELDSVGVAKRVRLQENVSPLNEGEFPIFYSFSDRWRMNIGAESFFFQEGHAQRYEKAKYGGVRIDRNGNSLLVGLYDEHRVKIE